LSTTHARKPIKASKDADFSLVSLRNKQRIIPRVLGTLGHVTLAKQA